MSKYDAVLPAQTAAAADSITVDAVIETSDDLENILVTALLIPPSGFTTVTGQATNNATISVRQLRAGAVIATPAAVTLGVGTNLVAETPLTVPIVAGSTWQAGDVIDVLMHQNGAGIAIGAGVIAEVEFN